MTVAPGWSSAGAVGLVVDQGLEADLVVSSLFVPSGHGRHSDDSSSLANNCWLLFPFSYPVNYSNAELSTNLVFFRAIIALGV
jgi:hypothetical protein